MRQTVRSRCLLPLAAGLLAAGCGDGGTDVGAPDFRPWETVSQMRDVVDPVLGLENALLGITAAGEALTQFSTETTAAVRTGPAFDIRSGTETLRATRSLWSTTLTLPAEIVGETLVWDVDAQEYEVDEAAGDAPADAVRVVYYSMDPFTGRPAEPLVVLGYIDLTDEDVVGEERLGIRVVQTPESGPVVVLDYIVGFSGAPEESSGNLAFTGTGTRSATDFDLLQAFAWSEAEDSESLALDYLYSAGEASVRLRMDASAAFEASAWEEIDLRVNVRDGAEGHVAVEVGIGPTGALEGEIRLDDVPVVNVHGVDGNPEFTDADGRALGADEVESLHVLWSLITQTVGVSNRFMTPGVLLLLPG